MQNLKKARFMLSTIESFKNKVRTRYDFAVAKLVILRVRARARPKPAGLGIVAPAKQSTASERKPQVAASAEDER